MTCRRYKKEKRHTFRKFIIWLLVIAAVIGAIQIFLGNYYEDTKQKFEMLNYPIQYSEYVEKASRDYELDRALIYAVIRTESSFDAEAKSNAGACGIMQVMPSSFEWLQEKRGVKDAYTADALFDPAICIDYGSYLLKLFYDCYHNEQCAVAAYNAGFVVGEWLENPDYSSDGKTLDNIPYPETDSYVDKVEKAKQMYIKLYFNKPSK